MTALATAGMAAKDLVNIEDEAPGKQHRGVQSLLVAAGLILLAVGAAILLAPVSFHASGGVELSPDPSLLSEIRAPGGSLAAFGALMVTGAFVRRLTAISALGGTLIYLSYGLSRVFGMAVDGVPSGQLVGVTVLELAVGLACAGAAFKLAKAE